MFDNVEVIKGYKDSYGKSMLVLVNEDMKEIRTVAKNPNYRKQQRRLNTSGHSNVIVPEYLEVIDITRNTMNKLLSRFKGYRHTQWQIW